MSKYEKNKIINMTFNELRDELAYCDNNPVKNLLIRKVMKEKYEYYVNKKKFIRYQKMKARITEYNNIKHKIKKRIEKKNIIRQKNYELEKKELNRKLIDINNINNNSDNNEILDESVNELINESLDELDENSYLYEDKFAQEIRRDLMNNQLMDRMNSELDIRNFRKHSVIKEFVPPFDNTKTKSYAFFDNSTIIPPTDFSSNRILTDHADIGDDSDFMY